MSSPDVPTPFPLAGTLPGLLQDDDLVQRLCTAFDEVLAPVVATLDCLPAYLDPCTAPDDVLAWLGEWVGLVLPDGADAEVRRRLVGAAAGLHRRRGTVRGVRDAVLAWFGTEPEVEESGAASWSRSSGEPLPGDPVPALHVRLRVPDPAAVDVDLLRRVVAAAAPAHVPTSVAVVTAD